MNVTFLITAAALLAPLQEPQPPAPQPPPAPVQGPEGLTPPGEDELVQLFGQVERRMREIDRLLYDASAGRAPGKIEESGIDKLLQRGRESSKQVLEDIDRILELAMQRAQEQQQQQSGGGGSGQQQQGEGSSPLDQQRNGQPGGRERTPEGQQEQGEGQGQNQEPKPEQGDKPQDGQENAGAAENQEGDGPPELETEKVAPGGGDDRWGDLPVQVRELFRAQGGGDLPPRYRDWIDSYYRRLNQRP